MDKIVNELKHFSGPSRTRTGDSCVQSKCVNHLYQQPILNCRKCTNRTSPECPKHPMHTITPHSRIKFSRLDSNQRPFEYQSNALNHLSYVRMLEPLLGIEPRTIDYKSIVIPFNYRGLLHVRRISKSRHLLLERSALPLSYGRV